MRPVGSKAMCCPHGRLCMSTQHTGINKLEDLKKDRENAPRNPSANEFSFLRSAELYVFESRTNAS